MIQTLDDILFSDNGITVDVLRLDLIHPEVSGNKWFKLKYYLSDAIAQGKEGLVSFGGAYSNHLVAMSFVCKAKGLSATAIIRGDDPFMSNPSLTQMREYGMELVFVSRNDFNNKNELIKQYLTNHPRYYYIPEGGQGMPGVRGASEIMQLATKRYSDIMCAVGTGTTMAGIINGSDRTQRITGISSLKTANTSNNAILDYINENTQHNNYGIIFDYHFGGYAKKNDALIRFMNKLYEKHKMPTDFVYTGKLFYALYDLIQQKTFPPGSNILVIHSGGLQGNRSLPQGILDF